MPKSRTSSASRFLKDKANVIFLGGAGLGKTHSGHRLGLRGAACAGHTVLFTTAIDIVNTLAAAQAAHPAQGRTQAIPHAPVSLVIDELGYLPIDKAGADLLFQVFSQRYETRLDRC